MALFSASLRAGLAGWGAILYAAVLGTASHVWYYRCVRAVGAGRAAVFPPQVPPAGDDPDLSIVATEAYADATA